LRIGCGVTVSYEAVRQWCLKFGQEFARKLRHRRGRLGDTWHLDEVFVSLRGKRHYLWRAVDQDGDVLDMLVQQNRDQHAAKRFLRQWLTGSARSCWILRLESRYAPLSTATRACRRGPKVRSGTPAGNGARVLIPHWPQQRAWSWYSVTVGLSGGSSVTWWRRGEGSRPVTGLPQSTQWVG